MPVVRVAWADRNIKVYGKQIEELHSRFPLVLPRIVNQVGNRAKTQVIRNLTQQTGLPRATIVRAIGDPTTARGRRLSYDMKTRGGNIRLKYLAPRETKLGVVAKPWGKPTLYFGSFMKGGLFPNRKTVGKFDGHVYRRLNVSGSRITQVRSGMFIPVEMTSGQTRRAFEAIAGPLLQERVEAVIAKLLP